MTWALIFISAVLIGTIVILFLVRDRNEIKTAGKNIKRSIPRKIPVNQTEQRKTAPKGPEAIEARTAQAEPVFSAEEERLPEGEAEGAPLRNKDFFREYIRSVIKVLLSSGTEGRAGLKPPLRIDDLDRDLERTVLDKIDRLKDFALNYKRCQVLDDPRISISEISNVVCTDPVLSARILKTVNSAYYGLYTKVDSIHFAITLMGIIDLKNIIFHDVLAKSLPASSGRADAVFNSCWEHSTLTALFAQYISRLFSGIEGGVLFTISLLHDIGKFILPDLPSNRSLDPKGWSSIRDINDEDETYGVNHAVIGMLAASAWNFTDLIIKVIEMHHLPSYYSAESLGLNRIYLNYLTALFLYNQLAKQFGREKTASAPVRQIAPLDPSFLSLFDGQKLEAVLINEKLFGELRKVKALTSGLD